MDPLAIYLREIRRRHARFSADDERHLARAAQAGDAQAEEKLLCSILPMAVRMAQKHAWSQIELEELVQIASEGALRGVRKFDPERGVRLTTFAGWWMRSALTDAIRKKRRCQFESLDELAIEIVSPPVVDEQAVVDELTERLRIRLDGRMRKLPERDRQILRAKLRGETHEQIGDRFGLSKARIGQIFQRALAAVMTQKATRKRRRAIKAARARVDPKT